ncbi:MAG: cell division protein FtsQ [Blastococcus sp.]|nr:cell division protein FtsQ [Blastococcus sp.]
MSRTGSTTRDRGSHRSAARRSGLVTPLPNRRARRAASRRRRPVQVAAAVLALGLLAWVLWGSPLLAVHSVRVDGVTTLPAAQVRETAGIAEGTPLLRVDIPAAQQRVAQLPQVNSVEVARGWPNTVVITVVERTPVAVVGSRGNRFLVDASGVLFDTITGDAPTGVIPLDVADPGPDDAPTMAALGALVSLPPDVREQVGAASATSAEDVSLTLADGTLVRWGSAEDTPAKASALAGVLAQIAVEALEPADTIDVSSPHAVVLR